MSSSFLVSGDLLILSHSYRGDWQGIICFSVPRYKVGGRRVDNGSIIGVESGDVTSRDMGLETRHWSTIVTAETGDIPRNYSSPLPASIRVTAWCGSCISNLWQHYSNHPAYPLHSVLGTCLHSFLDVSAHFWLGILLSSWVLYFTRLVWPPGPPPPRTPRQARWGTAPPSLGCSSLSRWECTPHNGILQ